MKNAMLKFVLMGLFTLTSASFAQTRVERLERLRPLVDSGIINQKGVDKALKYPHDAFETFSRLAESMKKAMEEQGASHIDELRGNKSALDKVREAGRESLEKSLKIDKKRSEDTLKFLIENCGCLPDELLLSSPLVPVYEESATAT